MRCWERKQLDNMKMQSKDKKGIALTVVIIILAVLVMMAGYIFSLGYNRVKITNAASGDRAKISYRAQAGVYDATTRIRKNYPYTSPGNVNPMGTDPGSVGTDFLNPGFDPAPYTIDVDGNGVMDARIDIGRANASGQRPIVSTGLDV